MGNFGNEPRPVEMLDKLTHKVLMRFGSITEAGKFMKKDNARVYINDCCKGKQKTALGYIWRYQKK